MKISAEHSLNKHFTRKKQHEAGPIVFCFHPPCQPRCPCRLGLAMKGSWCVRWPHTCTTFSKGNLRHLGRPTYHVLHVKLGHMRALKIHRFRFKLVMAFSNKIVANTYLRYTLPYTCIMYGAISLPRTGHEKMLALKNIISARLKDRTDQCSVGKISYIIETLTCLLYIIFTDDGCRCDYIYFWTCWICGGQDKGLLTTTGKKLPTPGRSSFEA